MKCTCSTTIWRSEILEEWGIKFFEGNWTPAFSVVRSSNGVTVELQKTALLRSSKGDKYFISGIGVCIVHIDWNEHDVQIEIYAEAPLDQNRCQKAWILIILHNNNLQF